MVSSCAPALMKLPSSVGAPASDASAALAEATGACRSVRTLTAEVGAAGSVDGQRVRGRMSVGVAAPASARIEAVAPFGAPVFIFAAVGPDATLLLPRENRVLERGRSDDVLDAVAGIPLDAAALRTALTGCASASADPSAAREPAADWRIVSDGRSDLYLHHENGRWRIAAVVHHAAPEWRAEYSAFQPSGLPQGVRLASSDRHRFDLRLSLSQVDTNVTLGPEVFRVQIPPSAERITIDELRHARPGIRED
jgi:hypothetical protein